MPTPAKGYFVNTCLRNDTHKCGADCKGKRVPGVTTVLGRFKESGALMYWAWQQGKDGKDFRESRDEAADAGTLTHKLVDLHLRGGLTPEMQTTILATARADIASKAVSAYGSYLRWAEQTKLSVVSLEIPMVSQRFRFGGTPDALMVGGDLVLGDWKTSNAVYSDYLLQLAAYGLLWEENNPGRPLKGFQLLRFSKDQETEDGFVAGGDFHNHFWPELKDAATAFLLLRKAYSLDARIKARIK